MSKILKFLEKDSVDADRDVGVAINSLILIAARASVQKGIASDSFLALCASLRNLSEIDDLSKVSLKNAGDA